MTKWTPSTRSDVEALLQDAVSDLHEAHAVRFRAMVVPMYAIPVGTDPHESVFVVAEHAGKVLYYSDIEEGWELEALNGNGGIDYRGCSQFELSNLMWQLFGDPK